MYFRQTRCEDVDWSHLALDTVQMRAFVNMVLNFQVLYKAENFLAS
jgi:hypothetical protein